MSLLKRLGKVVKKVAPVASFIPGPIGAIGKVASVVGASKAAMNIPGTSSFIAASLPRAVGALPRVLPGAGAVGGAIARGVGAIGSRAVMGAARKWSKRAAKLAGYAIIGAGVYDSLGNLVGTVQRRKMNPLNHRALDRAVRRVCSAKKVLKKVEKLTGGSKRSVACAPRRKKC